MKMIDVGEKLKKISLVFAGIVTQSDSTTIIVVLNIKGVIHCVRQAGHIYTQNAPRWLQI